jgi:alpha-tubulin suppressor-like RCC1 family protein
MDSKSDKMRSSQASKSQHEISIIKFENVNKKNQKPKDQDNLESLQNQEPNEFTEVFSFGSDRFGQLGLGEKVSA